MLKTLRDLGQLPYNNANGIAPDFRTLSIDRVMTSEVCNGKEAVRR